MLVCATRTDKFFLFRRTLYLFVIYQPSRFANSKTLCAKVVLWLDSVRAAQKSKGPEGGASEPHSPKQGHRRRHHAALCFFIVAQFYGEFLMDTLEKLAFDAKTGLVVAVLASLDISISEELAFMEEF